MSILEKGWQVLHSLVTVNHLYLKVVVDRKVDLNFAHSLVTGVVVIVVPITSALTSSLAYYQCKTLPPGKYLFLQSTGD